MMFGILNDLTKAAVSVVKLPVSAAADAVTMGGLLTDKRTPYTAENLSDLIRNLENATKPE